MIGLLGSMVGGRGGRMLGGMIGGRTGAMVGGLVGSLLGGRQLGRLARSVTGSLRGGSDGDGNGDGETSSLADPAGDLTEAEAEVLVKLMCNSAKADGTVDGQEMARIANELGDDITDEERSFLTTQLNSPFVPPAQMAAVVPSAMAAEAYAVSVLAIDVDTAAENQYLAELARSLDLSGQDRSEIHAELGLGNL